MCKRFGSVSWASKIQNIIATSSAEAAVYACVSAAPKLVYFEGISAALSHTVPSQPHLFVDNHDCISLCKQTSHPSITKHFTIKVHYLSDLCGKGELKLEYVPTDKQPADMLKKLSEKLKSINSGNVFLVAKT